jgi:hypothetical protein
MAGSYGQLGVLAEARRQPATALEFVVRCITVFDQFPHPDTDPAPERLVFLTRQFGVGALEATWSR